MGASREDRVSLCILDCPGIHCVDQADLELTEIDLPLSADIRGVCYQAYLKKFLPLLHVA